VTEDLRHQLDVAGAVEQVYGERVASGVQDQIVGDTGSHPKPRELLGNCDVAQGASFLRFAENTNRPFAPWARAPERLLDPVTHRDVTVGTLALGAAHVDQVFVPDQV
jgi:hypothetical protein